MLKPAARKILTRLGYRIEGIRYTPKHLLNPDLLRPITFDDAVCRLMFERGQDCTFLQIGAFDGLSTDPLRRYIERCNWSGLMMEPQPGPASRLRDLYRDNPNITILEAALDRQSGTRALYTVEAQDYPIWAASIASFDRDHILKHEPLLPGLPARVREIQVPCVTIDDVLSRFPSQHIDILQIDAEGADGFLISLFPFDRIKPAILHWERKNMTVAKTEETLDLLSSHGYRFAPSGEEDMLAVLGF